MPPCYALLLAAVSLSLKLLPTISTPLPSLSHSSHLDPRHYYHNSYPRPRLHPKLRAIDHSDIKHSPTNDYFTSQRAAHGALRSSDRYRGGERGDRDTERRVGEWKRGGYEGEGGGGKGSSVAEEIFQSIGKWLGFKKWGRDGERNGTRVDHDAQKKFERVGGLKGMSEGSKAGGINVGMGANEIRGEFGKRMERDENEGEGGSKGGDEWEGEGDGRDVWGGLGGQEREGGGKESDAVVKEGGDERAGGENEGAERDEMSEADVLEMVRLFRRFFSGVDRILSEANGEKGGTVKWTGGLKGMGSGSVGKVELEGGGGNGEANQGIGREKGKTELPDVAMALAEVDRLNRLRDLERRKMGEEEGEMGRERLKYMARAGVGEVDEEEEAADLESDRMVRELPKAAPSYGIRKKLLGRGEDIAEERGRRKGLKEWLLEGIETMIR